MTTRLCGWFVLALVSVSIAVAQPVDAKSAATQQRSTLALKNKQVITRGNTATVSFEVNASSNAKILDASGRDITAKSKLGTTAGATRELTLELVKNQPVTVLDSQRGTLAPTLKGRKYFPGTLVVAVDDPQKPGELAVFKGELYVEIQSKPLPWVATANAFQSGVTVALEASADSQVGQASFQKTSITLRTTGGGVISQPVVEFSSPGAISNLVLKVTEPEGAVGVTARWGDLNVEDESDVSRRTQRLALTASADRILGYGLGQTQLTVTRLDPTGNPLVSNSAQEIQFSVDRGGKIDPAVTAITAGQSRATVLLTSEGVGTSVVTVSAGTQTAVKTLSFLFPTAMILSALVGATLGGLARGFRTSGRKRVKWAKLVIEACVTSLVFTAFVWVGLVSDILPPAVAKSEIGVFVIAALAGFVGSSVLDTIAGKVFPKDDKA